MKKKNRDSILRVKRRSYVFAYMTALKANNIRSKWRFDQTCVTRWKIRGGTRVLKHEQEPCDITGHRRNHGHIYVNHALPSSEASLAVIHEKSSARIYVGQGWLQFVDFLRTWSIGHELRFAFTLRSRCTKTSRDKLFILFCETFYVRRNVTSFRQPNGVQETTRGFFSSFQRSLKLFFFCT